MTGTRSHLHNESQNSRGSGQVLTQLLQRRVFLLAVIARAAAVCFLAILGGSINDLSRDSAQYHYIALDVAQSYETGEIRWGEWIDEGWRQFIGLLYFLFFPSLLTITIFNVLISGLVAVFVYRVALSVFQNQHTAYATGIIFAVFPSGVYYMSLPLKEAVAGLAIAMMLWGLLEMIDRRWRQGLPYVLGGIMIVAAVRLYLVVVFLACMAISLLPMKLAGGMRALMQLGFAVSLMAAVLYVSWDYLGINTEEYAILEYYSVDRINDVRGGMSRGRAKMYSDEESAQFGQGLLTDAYLAAKGVFFFVFTLDVTNISRDRQLAALPEVLFFFLCIPSLYIGVKSSWNSFPERVLPIILITLAIIAVYGSGATNMGAMYRWRLQAVPYLVMMVVHGAVVRKHGLIYELVRLIRPNAQSVAA